jgi:hypothetical protein
MRTGAIIGRGAALAVIVAIVASPAALAQTSTAPPPQQSFKPPPGALIAPGDTPQLTLLYTGNVVGYLDPCG